LQFFTGHAPVEEEEEIDYCNAAEGSAGGGGSRDIVNFDCITLAIYDEDGNLVAEEEPWSDPIVYELTYLETEKSPTYEIKTRCEEQFPEASVDECLE
jgi:hypothetical protein